MICQKILWMHSLSHSSENVFPRFFVILSQCIFHPELIMSIYTIHLLIVNVCTVRLSEVPVDQLVLSHSLGQLKVLKKATGFLSWQTALSIILLIHHASSFQLIRKSMPVCSYSPARIQSICSVGNHFFQTLAKMATSDIFFKLDNK